MNPILIIILLVNITIHLVSTTPLKGLSPSSSKLKFPYVYNPHSPSATNVPHNNSTLPVPVSVLPFSENINNNNLVSASTITTHQIRRVRTKRIKIIRYKRIIRPIYISYSSSTKTKPSKSKSTLATTNFNDISNPTTITNDNNNNNDNNDNNDKLINKSKKSSSSSPLPTTSSPSSSSTSSGKENRVITGPITVPSAPFNKHHHHQRLEHEVSLTNPSTKSKNKKQKRSLDEEFPVVVHGMGSTNDWHSDKNDVNYVGGTFPVALNRNERMLKLSIIGRNIQMTNELCTIMIICLCQHTNTNVNDWGILESERFTSDLIQVGLFLVAKEKDYNIEYYVNSIDAFISTGLFLQCVRRNNEYFHPHDNYKQKIDLFLGKHTYISTNEGIDFIFSNTLTSYLGRRYPNHYVFAALVFGIALLVNLCRDRSHQNGPHESVSWHSSRINCTKQMKKKLKNIC